MNPALISLATSIAADKLSKKSPETGMTNPDLQFAIYKEEQKARRRKIALYTVGGLAVIIVGRKLYKDYKRRKSLNDQSPEAQIAREFQNAMHPSGLPKWIPDGTNEEKIFELARKIKESNLQFKDVASNYKNIYKDELMTELQNELDTDELTKFQSLLSTTETGESSENVYIFTIAEGEFYKKPEDNFGLAFKSERLITNAKLTGVIKEYTRAYMKIGDLYEIKTGTGRLFYVKTDKIERISLEVFRQKLNDKFVQQSQIVSK
jgi:hypothetical protein